VSRPTPLLDFFKRGEVARDVRMQAAEGALAPAAHEQLSLLILLLQDADAEIRSTAETTIGRIPPAALASYLARADVPAATREFFAARGIAPAAVAANDAATIEDPLIDTAPAVVEDEAEIPEGPAGDAARLSISQQIARMNFSERLKAAVKGSREMRALLIRDPNKMIAASVLSSPKLTENEVGAFARMANVSEDVLRTISANRAWMKNYGVVVGLCRNPKTPLAVSLNNMNRLNDRDLQMLSIDRNVPEPLRIAARKKVVAATSKK
jgi:hypothetical protein